jgi:hypothetical protein
MKRFNLFVEREIRRLARSSIVGSQEINSLLVGIITTILGGLIVAFLAFLASQAYKNRIHVRRISKPNDKDFNQLMHIYEQLLPANERSSPEDIIRWLNEYDIKRKDPNHTLEEYWLVGKIEGIVVSFLFFQYYTDTKLLFLSYYGVDKNAQEKHHLATGAMLEYFQKRIRKQLSQCERIVYETECPASEDSRETKRRKKARIELFKAYAKNLGFTAYQIDIDFIAPRLDIEKDTFFDEEHLALSYIPFITSPRLHSIKKQEIIKILYFVYCQVYGDSYTEDEEKDKRYRAYVASVLEYYEATLPEEIKLLS